MAREIKIETPKDADGLAYITINNKDYSTKAITVNNSQVASGYKCIDTSGWITGAGVSDVGEKCLSRY